MDLADDIAYSTYDLEDTFKANFLNALDIVNCAPSLLDKISKKVARAIGSEISNEEIIETFVDIFGDVFAVNYSIKPGEDIGHYDAALVSAEVSGSAFQLANNGFVRTEFTSDLVSRFISGVRVKFDENEPAMSRIYLIKNIHKQVEILKHLTFEATIMSPRLKIFEERGFDIITQMFEKLTSKNGFFLLPDDYREMYLLLKDDADKRRLICDFIAGMTDRYAVEFYGRLFSEDPQSIFKPF